MAVFGCLSGIRWMGRPFRACCVLAVAAMVLPGGLARAASGAIEYVSVHGESRSYPLDTAAKLFAGAGFQEQRTASGIAFTIAYEDEDSGFLDSQTGTAARQCLNEVLAYVAEVLNYDSGAMEIRVLRSEFDGSGPLASAGTSFLAVPGIQPGGALHRLNTGEKLAEGFPEITLTVDFGWPLAIGPEAPAADELDLFTVLLHEITHGIGFTTRIGARGDSNSFIGAYSVFDALLTDRAGTPLLDLNGLLPVFQADPAVLTARDVAFDGAYAVALLGEGIPVPVYSSAPFAPGSSLAHWAFGTVVGDTLMEPALLPGVFHREYTPTDLGAVIDLKNYSRGDGRPGEGPSGCQGDARNAAPRSASGDWVCLGLLVLILVSGGHVTSARFQGMIK